MKAIITNSFDNLVNILQKKSWGRILLCKIVGIISWNSASSKPSLEYRQGYWFRECNGIWISIGRYLRIRRSAIRGWDRAHDDELEMRRRWWFRSYSPQAGDFIVDVGAGMGEDAFVYSMAVGESGSVLAIEAYPATFKALSLFVESNGITNISLENLAASDTRGELWMSALPDDDWQCNSIVPHENPGSGIRVTAMRLDDMPMIVHRRVIDFMKINIEGAEVLALDGANETLAKTKNICVCCHDFLGSRTQTKERVCAILDKAGFILSFTSPDVPPYERDFVYGTKRDESL